jgi:hypothetical protein
MHLQVFFMQYFLPLVDRGAPYYANRFVQVSSNASWSSTMSDGCALKFHVANLAAARKSK